MLFITVSGMYGANGVNNILLYQFCVILNPQKHKMAMDLMQNQRQVGVTHEAKGYLQLFYHCQ